MESNTEDASYDILSQVLTRAYYRASKGKGKVRHANGKPFLEQPVFTITEALGGRPDPLLFQAVKKIYESQRLVDCEASVNELLDAIVYVAAAVILKQRHA